MNIGLFSDAYVPARSGVVTSLIALKSGLEQRGHKVIILAPSAPDQPRRGAGVYRCPSFPFNDDMRVRLALVSQQAAHRIVRQESLDVIHTHTEFTVGWAGKQAARATGLPLVHTAHTMYEEYCHYLFFGKWLSAGWVRRYLRLFLQGYDALVCPSPKAHGYFSSLMPQLPTAVIGNGLCRSQFDTGPLTREERERARQALGMRPPDRVILVVGRLSKEKRVLELLEALVPLLQEHRHYRVVFAGCGPAGRQMIRLADAHWVRDQVSLLGYVPWRQMRRLYPIADVVASASLSEVHPMTLIEASLCGLAVVARRDQAVIDLVEEGYNGYLVESDREIAMRLSEILSDDARREAFSSNALVLSGRFSAAAYAEKVETLYRQVLEKPRHGWHSPRRATAPSQPCFLPGTSSTSNRKGHSLPVTNRRSDSAS